MLEHHEVKLAPMDTFVTLRTGSNGQLELPDFAFAICSPGVWQFVNIMDIDILLGDPSLGSTLSAEENPPEDPVNTGPDITAVSNKKHCKHKGKSKTQHRSKSTGPASSTSETSPRCTNQAPNPKVDLVKQD